MRQLALAAAHEKSIRAIEGVYSALQGPNLETPAEYAMLRTLGSDCTGMCRGRRCWWPNIRA